MVGVRKAQGVVLSVVMASGCGSEGSGAEPLQGADVATGYATIEGVVELADNVLIKTDDSVETSVNQPPSPRECAYGEEGTSWVEDALVGAGGFSIKNAKPAKQKTHEVEIDDCRLEQRVLPVTVGDRIKVVNKGSYPYMPAMGEGDPSQVLLKGEARTFNVSEPGMHDLHCEFTAPCGKTQVAAFHHSIHATLDANGRFRLENVPAGIAVQISAWHPKLAAEVQTVTLEPGETRQLKFRMRPGKAAGLMVASTAGVEARAAN